MTRSSERAPDPAAAREARGQATGPDDEAGGPRYKSIYQQLRVTSAPAAIRS